MSRVITLDDVRRKASRILPRMIFDWVDGGAEDEETTRANTDAFRRVLFRPSFLKDVSKRHVKTTVLGTEIELPVLLAPTGLQRLVHWRGELAAASAAASRGTIYILSTASSYSIEDVARLSSGPLWFQLYLWKSREFVRSLVDRAQAAGYRALCLTVDVPVHGARERDIRNGMTIPLRPNLRSAIDVCQHIGWLSGLGLHRKITFANLVGIKGGGGDSAVGLGTFIERELINPAATWEDFSWLRTIWSGPMVVKGIMTADDARRAVDLGAEALIVSNHGGRQLDGAGASLDALIEVVDAVGHRAEILVDGGFRRGTHVVKALALGARACLIGRPYLYGLATAGEAGVGLVLDIMRAEIVRTLGLIGCSSVDEVDRSVVSVLARHLTIR